MNNTVVIPPGEWYAGVTLNTHTLPEFAVLNVGNVVQLPAPSPRVTSTIKISASDLEQVRDQMLKVEASVRLILAVLDKAPLYTETAAMEGVQQVLDGLERLLGR